MTRIAELARRAWGEIRCGHDPLKAIRDAIVDHARNIDRPEWDACTPRQIEVLRLIQVQRRISGGQVARHLGIQPETACALLRRLKRHGLVRLVFAGCTSTWVLVGRGGRPRKQGKIDYDGERPSPHHGKGPYADHA
jgi:DNA-binding CsgD family transcriptional regulator